MKKMSPRAQKWLKCFHIFFAALWTGAAMCMLLNVFILRVGSGGELYGVVRTLKIIDDFVIIPGAMGCLLTGLIYSIWTQWGFFKHNWIIIKWVINLYGVIFGTFWLGPWLNALPPLVKERGLDVLNQAVFPHNRDMLMTWGSFQFLTIVVALFVSVLKPFKRKKA